MTHAHWSGALGDALSALIDHRGRTPKKLGGDWTDAGVPVYSAIHVKGGRLETEGARRVSWEMYERWMPIKLRAGDVLLTSEAPLGEVARLRSSAPACLGQRLFGLRPRTELLDSRYLFYWLQHPIGRNQLMGRASGTTVSGIRQAELVQVRLDLPPLPIQRKIAAVLAAYDELIENNLRRIEILEEMAQTVYREWFVEFRFPGHEDARMVDSELGPIPEGWEVYPFSGLADFINGFAFKPAHLGDDGLPIVKIKELKNGVTADTPRNPGGEVPAKFHIDQGDLLFSWSADLVVQLWPYGTALLNQHLFRVVPTAPRITVDYLVHALNHRLPEFRARAQGTTMKHIKRAALTEVQVAVPPAGLVAQFAEVVRPIHELVRNLVEQNANLRATRDLLLPILVSGEIDVSDLDIGIDWLVA